MRKICISELLVTVKNLKIRNFIVKCTLWVLPRILDCSSLYSGAPTTCRCQSGILFSEFYIFIQLVSVCVKTTTNEKMLVKFVRKFFTCVFIFRHSSTVTSFIRLASSKPLIYRQWYFIRCELTTFTTVEKSGKLIYITLVHTSQIYVGGEEKKTAWAREVSVGNCSI